MDSLIHDQATAVGNNNKELIAHLRSVRKEIVQHHILRALNSSGILDEITFMGGTCLRLCYGGLRFSEDLDFRGGGFDGLASGLGTRLQGALLKRGVSADVRRAGASGGVEGGVERWWVRVVVRKDAPKDQPSIERIKLEIDSRQSPEERELGTLVDHFGGLAGDLSEAPLIHCMPMLDICADKLAALPLSVVQRPEYPRYRDVFDLAWALPRLDDDALTGRAAELAGQRGLASEVRDAISKALPKLRSMVDSEGYRRAMSRFLIDSVADRTVNDPEHRSHSAQALRQHLERLSQALAPPGHGRPNRGGSRRRSPTR